MLKNIQNTAAPCLLIHIIIFIEKKCQVQSSIDQITSIVHLYNTLVLLLSALLINAYDLVYNEIYSADIIFCIFIHLLFKY